MAYGLWCAVRRCPVLRAPCCAVSGTWDGLWPMVRREAVFGATRALRCRGWHEVRVDERI
eukprot:5759098-Prymnesium_polylepis.1